MMILRSAAPSPFARKVRIAAAILGVADMRVEDADLNAPTDTIRAQNPLGKVPTLVLEDGTALYDSRVILAYLDARQGGGLFPTDPAARLKVDALQALCDGVLDALILQVYEARWRPEERREPKWLAYQAGKVERALATLEAAPPAGPVDAGQITLACALGYLDLRFPGTWRDAHPKLVAWLDGFAARVPSFAATAAPPVA